ncbi:uncharacterized protein L201_004765 [Kwoniella dendrophila CBS 6074]|uniref:Cytochrome P450 n=1 Tax=Kwoniella dendrophila CBS 6074 TaxID=1295534 RepID=A0AAX4JWR6_9TREE
MVQIIDSIRIPTITQLLLGILTISLVYLADLFILRPFTSPLKKLPGPVGGSGLSGHSLEIMDLHAKEVYQWISQYGKTFKVNGPFGSHHRIFTLDPRALSHVLNSTQIYFKSNLLRNLVRKYMKNGLIVAEGNRHKLQRKISQGLFSRNGLKGMIEIVGEKADQFRDIVHELVSNPSLSTPYSPVTNDLPNGSREIDIYSSASRCTFDIIGQIGIGHIFDSTGNWHGEGGELFEKYERMQYPFSGIYTLLGLLWPWLDKLFPSGNTKLVAKAMDPLEKLSQIIMHERQKEINEGKRELPSDNRDLLTLMLRSNMTKGISPEQKLRDDEITGQLATFMFAGSDTTAGTIAMGLYQLATHSPVQDTLRSELLGYGDNLPFEQIDELPYLDAVVKEILRINPSLPGTVRQAQQDDIIPLSEPVTLTNGKVVHELNIRKGQLVHVPIEHLHKSEEIWGADASEFNPDRFLGLDVESDDDEEVEEPKTPSTPATFSDANIQFESPWKSKSGENTDVDNNNIDDSSELTAGGKSLNILHKRKESKSDIYLKKIPRKTSIPKKIPLGPGVWPNFMTFIDGPRRCIGYKLALIEIKLMFYKIIRDFEILPKQNQKVWRWNMMSTRPYVEGTLHQKGSSLPIIFKLYKDEGESTGQDEKGVKTSASGNR